MGVERGKCMHDMMGVCKVRWKPNLYSDGVFKDF